MDDFEMLTVLGKGTFGKVYIFMWECTTPIVRVVYIGSVILMHNHDVCVSGGHV